MNHYGFKTMFFKKDFYIIFKRNLSEGTFPKCFNAKNKLILLLGNSGNQQNEAVYSRHFLIKIFHSFQTTITLFFIEIYF